METSTEKYPFKKKLHNKDNRFLTASLVQWAIFEYFQVGDTVESVLSFNEILKVELKNDNVQSFSTRWDETKENLEHLYWCQLQQ